MKKTIYIYYWKAKENFGDLLAPFILKKLSDKNVEFKYLHSNRLTNKLRLLKDLICNLSLSKDAIYSLFQSPKSRLHTVGSILSAEDKNCEFWGSGFMNKSDVFSGGTVHAVRGYYSVNKLQELGFKKCNVVGDPALLLPLIVKGSQDIKYQVSIIPHWTEVDLFKEKYKEKYHIIDFRTDDIYGVINEITSSKYILSTSLHGLIVSHAYRIPALWIKNGYIHTDGFKFKDYFSSININEYDGFLNHEELLNMSQLELTSFLNDKMDLCNPDYSIIKNIQYNLLSVAPFKLNENFRLCRESLKNE